MVLVRGENHGRTLLCGGEVGERDGMRTTYPRLQYVVGGILRVIPELKGLLSEPEPRKIVPRQGKHRGKPGQHFLLGFRRKVSDCPEDLFDRPARETHARSSVPHRVRTVKAWPLARALRGLSHAPRGSRARSLNRPRPRSRRSPSLRRSGRPMGPGTGEVTPGLEGRWWHRRSRRCPGFRCRCRGARSSKP